MEDKYGKTLSIDDFYLELKSLDVKYITQATVYFEDGTEMKTSLDKKVNKKWLELKTKWKFETGELKPKNKGNTS